MAIDFPSSPTTGQSYTDSSTGQTWIYNGTGWASSYNRSSVVRQSYTASAAQTTFTVSGGYSPGLLDVYQNGVKLVSGSDYTATNGTTFVLTAAATAGDSVEAWGIAQFTIANMLPLSGGTLSGGLTAPTLASTGNSTVGGTLGVTGNTTVGGTLNVTGSASVGDLSMNSGYGSAAPAYGCRAWVYFVGNANTNLTGTYSQSGTTVTVTATAHGLIVGSKIYVDITSGTGVDGEYTVATVPTANTFTYTAGTSLTTSGNVTLTRNTVQGSANVTSVADAGTGDYIVNFATPMPDNNYAILGAQGSQSYTIGMSNNAGFRTANYCTVRIMYPNGSGGGTAIDTSSVYIAIIR